MGFKLIKNSGFTTVEILIASAIGVVIVLFAINILLAHLRLFAGESALIDITGANKIALDEIVNEVRESQSVVNSCTSCGSDSTGAHVLILKIWPLDASGNPYDPNNYDYIVYKRDSTDNTKIRKIIYAYSSSTRKNSNKIIGTNISGLDFTYGNPDPTQATDITIKVKNTAATNGKTQDVDREAKAVIRNK